MKFRTICFKSPQFFFLPEQEKGREKEYSAQKMGLLYVSIEEPGVFLKVSAYNQCHKSGKFGKVWIHILISQRLYMISNACIYIAIHGFFSILQKVHTFIYSSGWYIRLSCWEHRAKCYWFHYRIIVAIDTATVTL